MNQQACLIPPTQPLYAAFCYSVHTVYVFTRDSASCDLRDAIAKEINIKVFFMLKAETSLYRWKAESHAAVRHSSFQRGRDMMRWVYTHTHMPTYTHTHILLGLFIRNTPSKSPDRKQYLLSLSPRHQQPPSFGSWWIEHYSSTLPLRLFFSFSLLILPLPLSSSSPLFVCGDAGGEEGSARMSVWTFILSRPILVPSRLLFSIFFCF